MIDNPLSKKLKIKEGQKILILNAPVGFESSLMPLPEKTKIDLKVNGKKEAYDLVLLFTINSTDLQLFADQAIQSVKTGGILWFAYPKLSSKIKSDLTRDEGWSFLDPYMLTGVASIAIDDTWSGMRFKYAEDGISHGQRMAEYKANMKKNAGQKVVIVPDDFQKALNNNPKALQVFDKFAYTHRKEYVRWIEEAKKQETRENRIIKAIERISEGVKFS